MRVETRRRVHLQHRAPLRRLVGWAAEDEVNARDAQAHVANYPDGQITQLGMQHVGDLSNVTTHPEVAAGEQLDAFAVAGDGRECAARVGQVAGDSCVVSAKLSWVPGRAAASLTCGDELANAGAPVADHVRPCLLARHEDVAVEDDDRAVAAAHDALHQQLLRRGKDLAGCGVELRARIRDPDIACLAQAPDVIEAASGRDGTAGAPEHTHGRVLIDRDRRRAQCVQVPLQTVKETDTTGWKCDPSRVVRTGYDLELGTHELACLPQTPQERCRHPAMSP
jgi:hypothetical protein